MIDEDVSAEKRCWDDAWRAIATAGEGREEVDEALPGEVIAGVGFALWDGVSDGPIAVALGVLMGI